MQTLAHRCDLADAKVAQNSGVNQENARLKQESVHLAQEQAAVVTRLEADILSKEEERAGLEKRLQTVQKEVFSKETQSQEKINQLTAELKKLNAEMTLLRERLQETGLEFSEKEKSLAQALEKAIQEKLEADRCNAQLTEGLDEALGISQQREKTIQQLTEQQAEAEALNGELHTINQTLHEQLAAQAEVLIQKDGKISDAEGERDTARQDAHSKTEQMAKLKTLAAQVDDSAQKRHALEREHALAMETKGQEIERLLASLRAAEEQHGQDEKKLADERAGKDAAIAQLNKEKRAREKAAEDNAELLAANQQQAEALRALQERFDAQASLLTEKTRKAQSQESEKQILSEQLTQLRLKFASNEQTLGERDQIISALQAAKLSDKAIIEENRKASLEVSSQALIIEDLRKQLAEFTSKFMDQDRVQQTSDEQKQALTERAQKAEADNQELRRKMAILISRQEFAETNARLIASIQEVRDIKPRVQPIDLSTMFDGMERTLGEAARRKAEAQSRREARAEADKKGVLKAIDDRTAAISADFGRHVGSARDQLRDQQRARAEQDEKQTREHVATMERLQQLEESVSRALSPGARR